MIKRIQNEEKGLLRSKKALLRSGAMAGTHKLRTA
jgi:hypothetical protein